jgi:hypothetical protein
MADSTIALRDFAFSDGQYLGHRSDGRSCVMEYLNWREELFRFEFQGVAMLRAFGGSASLCEAKVAADSVLIDEARRVLADDWGTSGGPRDAPLIELTITDDVPVFSIVFTSVRIVGPLRPDQRMTMAP